MYGHQVIEDCKNIDVNQSNIENINLYTGIIGNLCKQIKLCTHFNLGTSNDIYEVFKKNEGKAAVFKFIIRKYKIAV